MTLTPPAEVEPLENLARQANEAHRNAVKAGQSMISHAMESGSYLLAAKEQCAHGEWLPWLAENFEGSERTARGYMTLVSNRQRVADLPPETSLRGALAAIAEAKKPEVTAEVVRDDPPEPEPEILEAEVVEPSAEEVEEFFTPQSPDEWRRYYMGKIGDDTHLIAKALNRIVNLRHDLAPETLEFVRSQMRLVIQQANNVMELTYEAEK